MYCRMSYFKYFFTLIQMSLAKDCILITATYFAYFFKIICILSGFTKKLVLL